MVEEQLSKADELKVKVKVDLEESPLDFILREFENPHVQALLLFHIAVTGIDLRQKGLLAMGLGVLSYINNWQLCRGGSHLLAHALGGVLLERGGILLEQAPVKRILVDDSRARGVEIENGGVYRARRAVVSAVDPHQTFLDFLGEEVLGKEFCARVRSLRYGHGDVLFGVHLALKEPPRYAAARNDPDLNRLFNVNIGYETPEDLIAHYEEIDRGEAPAKPRLEVSCNTLFDPSQAPAGMHTGLIWQFAPFELKDGGAERWDRIGRDYAWKCVEAWQEYAPNLTRDKILGIYPYTPLDIRRKLVNMRRGGFHVVAVTPEQALQNRPLPELAMYRAPLLGLYLCGASQYVYGGILATPAWNCLQVMAQDLGIEDKLPISSKIWFRKRREWLERALGPAATGEKK
jgi:phytoene dehydrogenase-like protein